ncbi:MAG: helix-turn-helix domain-containing protein [Gammaproteobacteria bacterium]|nr:helix-turn-helix domain-containing protein [Gammaproteobacteria bacterium]MDE0412793.1 helix-turn-helix domain-containing protein [Gammaproteobacteria bacterium]
MTRATGSSQERVGPDAAQGRVGPLSPTELTATEYELLSTLANAAGRVVTYYDLMMEVWPKRGAKNPGLIRNFVKQLRAKLGDDASAPEWILNVRGVVCRKPRSD